MNYDHTITLTIPASLYDIACAISRAMDPDSGGAASYGPRTRMVDDVEVTPDTYTTSAPCTQEFYAQAQAMLSDPAMLFAAVSQDYATRWPDLTAPTLAECESFIAAIIPPQQYDPVIGQSEPAGVTL